MARVSRAVRLVDKAEAAMVAAVEVYNKPLFPYRCETFAILALNAWELLAKAQLVAANGNSARCLLVTEPIRRDDGTPTRRKRYKRNRSGNFYTKSIWEVIGQLDQTPINLHPAVKANLELLTELRDNSVHFVTPGPQLAAQVQAVAVACVTNFVTVARERFGRDLSAYSLALMPISFLNPPKAAQAYIMSADEQRLTKYISAISEAVLGDEAFHVAVSLDFSVNKVPVNTSGAFSLGRAPDGSPAARLTVSEEEMKKIYRWGSRELLDRLRSRYLDLKANPAFYKLRRDVERETNYVWRRPRDPAKPERGDQMFFAPEIVAEFDKHYTRA